ncbi:DUF1540 domain-containing protein [Moorella sp. Hama-1]|uniref:DUF1540 domain-containing protein n=1 Tax=Moorella sp. Hama-1 TaxID=2138101 RepID=UPI000D65E4D3|nr:DUF1540 domain-containing protein [Moorella sp. Hama-1]MDN5362630.1 hypothetical protein [Moorella sp. (in: firmicutes)]BCV20735.1 hypothetical protein hamaS1_08040 [Moorella sp. Hama-1]
MPKISCSVNNCHYWSSGNICDASQILVTSDSMSKSQAQNVDAPMSGTISPTPVNSSTETCCKTFVAKGSAGKTSDGITRK